MQVKEAVEAYKYAILLHSDETQVWYIGRLNAFVMWCEDASLHDGRVLQLEDITATELRKYIHYLSIRPNRSRGKQGRPLASHTVNGHARTIRTFLYWCAQEDGIEELVKQKTAKSTPVPKVDDKVIEIFTADQIAALFAACEKEYAPHIVIRDKAMLSLLLDTGIRAQELTTLQLDDIHLDPKDAYILVHGKGRKEREIGLGLDARTMLHKYITRYRNATLTVPSSEKHVFLSRFCKPLKVNGVDQMLYRLAEWAHVEGVRCSAHTFRHTFAVEYLKAGGDLFKLSRLLGHASVQITSDVYLKAFKARDARADGLSVLDGMQGKKKKRKPP